MSERFTSRAALRFAAGAAVLLLATAASAQRLTGTENGEWRYLGGDAGHTRSSALDQIDGGNFSDLEVAWIWRGDNYGPNLDYFNRATPIYVDGVVYTVASPRRQVVAIDPATGETLWSFRESAPVPAPALAPAGLRQGGGLCRGERPRGHLRHQPRVLPVGARRRDRASARELGQPHPPRRLPADRAASTSSRPSSRTGAAGSTARPATTPATAFPASSAWSPPRPRPSW